MKAILYFFSIAILTLSLNSCKSKSKMYGAQIKDPFSSEKYMSDKKYFRGTGKGQSMKDNVAAKKADMDAKSELAGQVNITMKEVADAYMSQSESANGGEVYEKFQNLSREVVNTQLADLRKVEEKKYYDGEKFTVFVVYEIKKKDMFKYMKKQAKTQNYVDKKTQKLIEDLIDKQIEESED